MASTAISLSRWQRNISRLHKTYRENQPFPHILLPHFLPEGIARAIVREFPSSESDAWIQYRHVNEDKIGNNKLGTFPPVSKKIFRELMSPRVVTFLSNLTGIPGLVPDPTLEGGGIQQTERGGFLNVHADFVTHPHKNLERRVNLLIYFTPGWKPSWGGALELWDTNMRHRVRSYPPTFNTALIFTTTATSYHGLPHPLSCPPSTTRKSFNLYYYTPFEKKPFFQKPTQYKALPTDSAKKKALIRIDQYVVSTYTFVKGKLGLSDDFASRVLNTLFGRRK